MALISVVIPVKNGKILLEKCIKSVLAQTYEKYEIIVLTDVSTNDDGTLDYLKSLKISKLRIEESSQLLGIQQNWERILHISKGEYFTILGYDDILYPDFLKELVELIYKYPAATLYQTHFDYIDKTDTVIRASPNMEEKVSGESYLGHVLRSEYPVIATGFVMRSSDYAKVGGVPVKYPNLLYADFELWLRLSLLGFQVISPRKLFAFRIHQSTTTVSSTRTTLKGIEYFVNYLVSLNSNPTLAATIKKDGPYFLKFHCNGIAYRLIRSPVREENLSVSDVIKVFNNFASKLGLVNLNFENVVTIRIALFIDSFFFSRKFYLWLKKVYAKPLIRSPF